MPSPFEHLPPHLRSVLERGAARAAGNSLQRIEPPGLTTPLSQHDYSTYLSEQQPERAYMGPLKYVGEALGKLARPVKNTLSAVTDVLQGHPESVNAREWLGAVPFSDTLGITDPKQAVTSDQLLSKWGWQPEEGRKPLLTPFANAQGELNNLKDWVNPSKRGLAEFALDVGTDPLTYATFGAGGAAKSLGTGAVAQAARAPSLATRALGVLGRVPMLGRLKNVADEAALTAAQQAGKKALIPLGSAEAGAASPLTAAGKALAANDLLPLSRAARLRGFRSLEELPQELIDLASNPATAAPLRNHLNEIIEGARSGNAVPLSGVARFSVPFLDRLTGGRAGLTVGTNAATRPLAQALTFPFGGLPVGASLRVPDLWNAYGHHVPGVTKFRQLFSQAGGGGQASAAGQAAYRNSYAPLEGAERQAGMQLVPEVEQALAGAGGKQLLSQDPAHLRYLNDLVEGLPATPPAGLPPQAVAAAQGQAARMKQALQDEIAEAKRLGIDVHDWSRPGSPLAPGMDYFPRSATGPKMAGQPQGKMGGTRDLARRESLHRSLDASRNTINDMARDPVIAGLQRGAVDDAQAVAHVVNNYLDVAAGGTRVGGVASAQHAQELVQWLKSADPQAVHDALAYFGRNPLSDLQTHLAGAAAQRAYGKTAHQELARAAVPFEQAKALQAAGRGGKFDSVSHALNELGLAGGGEYQAARLSELLGKTVDKAELANWHVPTDLLEGLRGLRTQGSESAIGSALRSTVLPYWDSFLNLWKAYQTVPFPAHHWQNFLGGVFQNVMHGVGSVRNYWDAMQLLRGKSVNGLSRTAAYARHGTDELATQAAVAQLAGAGLLRRSGHHLGELTGGAASGVERDLALPGISSLAEQFAGPESWKRAASFNPLAARGVGLKSPAQESAFAPLRLGEGLLEGADRLNRLAHYLGKVREGNSHLMASASTLKAHLDWRQLTGFERDVMRRILPFYSYSRLVAPQMISQTLQSPGRNLAGVKALDALQDQAAGYVPEYLRGTGAIPAGEAVQSREPTSGRAIANQVFAVLPSLPPEDALRLIHDIGGPAQGTRVASNLAANLHPLLKYGVESLTGKDLRSRKDKQTEMSARWYEDPEMKLARQASEVVPGGRLFSLIKRAQDATKPGSALTPAQVLAGEALPVHLKQADLVRAKYQDQQDVLNELVTQVPGVRGQGRDAYVPTEEQHKLIGTPYQMLMRANATHNMAGTVTSLRLKAEEAEAAKPELALLKAAPQLDSRQKQRLQDLEQAVFLQPYFLLKARELEQQLQTATGTPGLRVPGQGNKAAKKAVGLFRRAVRTPGQGE